MVFSLILIIIFLIVLYTILPRYNEPLLLGEFITPEEADYIKKRASKELKESNIYG